MKKITNERRIDNTGNAIFQMVRIIVAMILLVAVCIGIFLQFYGKYNDKILYSERLNQMQNVTAQLFSGLEDVVKNQWESVDILCNYMEQEQTEAAITQETLQEFLANQAKLNNLDRNMDSLLAIDDRGRYYTQNGKEGTLQELDYLLDEPAKISFVSNSVTTNRTKMVFLQQLETPVSLENGTRIIYYGIARDMSELEPYFDCAAYEGNNAVYVVDPNGMKLFTGRGGELIKGYNIYNVLEGMEYLHNSSFDVTRQELEETGTAYSNVMLNGEEYYYAMYRMESAEWTLLFFVRSSAVALNTVELVNTTMAVVMIFALFMAALSTVIIIWLLRRQQKKELAAAEQNNREMAAVNEKLEEAVKTAEAAFKAAESANKAKSDFLANMSHDIRTPMNAIVGITNLMPHVSHDPEKVEEYTRKIQASSHHLLGLINDVLDMSKIESSEVEMNITAINLADQVMQIETIIRPQTLARRQSFEIRVEDIQHENIFCDGTRLQQVLQNILSNAVKYTPEGGNIVLDIRELMNNNPSYAKYCFTITDNGMGMSKDFVKHIFEPFTRAERSVTNKIQGTGLGMAITKTIVELMGGTIRVESEVGRGSSFEVVLEFKVDNSKNGEMKQSNILLISKEQMLTNNVKNSVEKNRMHFYAADSVEQAENVAQNVSVNIVLLDGRLKEENAEEQICTLREIIGEKSLVFWLAYYKQEDFPELYGADGFLYRPFFFSNLQNEVKRLNRMAAASEPEQKSVLKGMRFLCAEDNELNAEILTATMELQGATCKICADGVEIVKEFERAADDEYDAILMDVQMPNMDGYEATRRIRSSKKAVAQTIPIIAMTANAFSEDVQQSMAAGMDAHISKPIDMALLEKTIRGFATTPPRVHKRQTNVFL